MCGIQSIESTPWPGIWLRNCIEWNDRYVERYLHIDWSSDRQHHQRSSVDVHHSHCYTSLLFRNCQAVDDARLGQVDRWASELKADRLWRKWWPCWSDASSCWSRPNRLFQDSSLNGFVHWSQCVVVDLRVIPGLFDGGAASHWCLLQLELNLASLSSSRFNILGAHFESNSASRGSHGLARAVNAVDGSFDRGPWTNADQSGSCSRSEKGIIYTPHHAG